jgi:KAP family P-loop domain
LCFILLTAEISFNVLGVFISLQAIHTASENINLKEEQKAKNASSIGVIYNRRLDDNSRGSISGKENATTYSNNVDGPSTHIERDRWTIRDSLGYHYYAYAIAKFLTNDDTKPPISIGIQAPWGGGKTSLMRMVQNILDPGALREPENDKIIVEETKNKESKYSTIDFQDISIDKPQDLLKELPLEKFLHLIYYKQLCQSTRVLLKKKIGMIC